MRKRSDRHEETLQAILKAARELVLEVGHESLSLREVARASGFSPASLYEYFDGKETIIAALAKMASSSLARALERRIKRAANDREVLVELAMGYVTWAKRHPEDFLLLFSRLPSKRKGFTDVPALDSPYRVVLDSVARARERGLVQVDGAQGVEHLAYGLWAAAHGMAMLQLNHLSAFQADFVSVDRAILEQLVAGYAAP